MSERLTDAELIELELGSAVSAAAVREIKLLRRVAKIANLLQCDDRNSFNEFLTASGWQQFPSGYWTHPRHKISSTGDGDFHPDTAMSMELDLALNALTLTEVYPTDG